MSGIDEPVEAQIHWILCFKLIVKSHRSLIPHHLEVLLSPQ